MTDIAPKSPRPLEITAGAEPIKLGSILLTIVEPRRGHEVAYNRWYERDHFYAGCMIGPYQFAGRRFVATADLKALRQPDPSPITGQPALGSYVAVYYVPRRLPRHLEPLGRSPGSGPPRGRPHVRRARSRPHAPLPVRRRAPPRSRRRADRTGARPPVQRVRPLWIDRADGVTDDQLQEWLRNEHLPALLPGTDAALVGAFSPLPLLVDAPGDVPRNEASDQRTLLLWFLDAHPSTSWEPVILEHERKLAESGLGTVIAALPFIPTIPGTDTYTDQLWG